MEIVKFRKIWFSFSGILILIAALSISIFGFRASLDFIGGAKMEIVFLKNNSENNIKTEEENISQNPEKNNVSHENETEISEVNKLNSNEEKENDLKPNLTPEENLQNLKNIFGDLPVEISENSGKILARSPEISVEKKLELENKINQIGGSLEKFSIVGPTMGKVFRQRAIWAVVITVFAIIIFVAFAFRKIPKKISPWKFSFAAILALAHDVFLMIGLFSILGKFFDVEINALFITAVLTVLGFSVNDTIVVFDRIRENLKKAKQESFTQITEISLRETMRRSINTSISTLIVLGAMLFFFRDFPDLFYFVLALSFGILIGTYSSIFLAAPILVCWQKK